MTNEKMLALRQYAQKLDVDDARSTKEMAAVTIEKNPTIKGRIQNAASRLIHLQTKINMPETVIKSKRQTQLG